MTDMERRRIARYAAPEGYVTQEVRGVPVVSDRNSGTRLAFRIDGTQGVVVLDTTRWAVEFETLTRAERQAKWKREYVAREVSQGAPREAAEAEADEFLQRGERLS